MKLIVYWETFHGLEIVSVHISPYSPKGKQHCTEHGSVGKPYIFSLGTRLSTDGPVHDSLMTTSPSPPLSLSTSIGKTRWSFTPTIEDMRYSRSAVRRSYCHYQDRLKNSILQEPRPQQASRTQSLTVRGFFRSCSHLCLSTIPIRTTTLF